MLNKLYKAAILLSLLTIAVYTAGMYYLGAYLIVQPEMCPTTEEIVRF